MKPRHTKKSNGLVGVVFFYFCAKHQTNHHMQRYLLNIDPLELFKFSGLNDSRRMRTCRNVFCLDQVLYQFCTFYTFRIFKPFLTVHPTM